MGCKIDDREVIRLGDSTDHGGTVIKASSQTMIEGRPIARVGDLVMCPQCQGVYPITEGHETSCEDNMPIALEGHRTACGARLISSM